MDKIYDKTYESINSKDFIKAEESLPKNRVEMTYRQENQDTNFTEIVEIKNNQANLFDTGNSVTVDSSKQLDNEFKIAMTYLKKLIEYDKENCEEIEVDINILEEGKDWDRDQVKNVIREMFNNIDVMLQIKYIFGTMSKFSEGGLGENNSYGGDICFDTKVYKDDVLIVEDSFEIEGR